MRRFCFPLRNPALSATIVAISSAAALGQDAAVIPDPEPTGQAPEAGQPMKFGLGAAEYWFDVKTQYEPAGDIGNGEVNSVRASGEIGVMYPLGPRDRLWVSAYSEYVNSDFKSTHEFAPDGNLYSDLLEYTFAVRSITHLGGKWSLLMGGSATSAGEAHAEIDQSLTYRGAVGASYQVNPNLQIGLMGVISTRLEEDTVFLPFPVLELTYEFDEKWRAEVSTFTGAKVVYALSHTLDLSLSGEWRYTEYRLDHDGPFEGGAFRQTRVPISIGADWRFRPQYTLHAALGVNIVNEWEFVDSAGNDLFETDVESDVFASFGIRIDF